jgi:hypothetical protein
MTRWARATAVAAVVTATVLVVLVAPASAGTTQISGVGTPVPECGGTDSDFTIEMTGSLVGCWYTTITDSKFNPSGTYQETGTETFVGCLNGTTCGTFSTTYTFTAKFVDHTLAQEIHGRCHHSVVGGTGGFEGAGGMVNFKDDVEAGIFLYRGHIN